MIRGIFNNRKASGEDRRQERGSSPFPEAGQQSGPAPAVDTSVDASLLALSRELSSLAEIPVSQAAKERGWASLQRELERHPVRAAGKAVTAQSAGSTSARTTRPGHPRSWRWALSSAAAVVAVVAALVGTYSGGLLTADNGEHPTTVTSVVSSDTTEPTTVTTEGSTVSTGQPGTTGGSDTTQSPDSSGTTDSPGSTTQAPGTTATTGDNKGSGGTTTTRPAGTTTTRPASTSTTGEQQYTAAEREGSARALAIYLAEMVITGNTSGAQQLVAAGAQTGLAQMRGSLSEPYGYTDVNVQSLGSDLVRVTLGINDRVVRANGEVVETIKRFAIKVRVDEDGAVVTAINGL